MGQTYNFNPGPSVLPRTVLEHVQSELLDYQGSGMSVMEMSHRSKIFEGINSEAEARLKRLLGVGGDYRALFLQGGASLQFAMLPMNFLRPGITADYILTDGSWSERALAEASALGQTHVAGSTKDENYRRVPEQRELQFSDGPVYAHITSNNTIYGTQWHYLPDTNGIPLIADMSSDILSRQLDGKAFAMLYAGAQKNLGPSGVTAVVIRQNFLEHARGDVPTMLRYKTHAKNDSLYNTPPTFGIYMLNLVLKWIEDQGLDALAQRNQHKAAQIYDAIDRSGGFYRGHAVQESRSLMNATFRLPSEELERQFVSEATAEGMVGLGGHRSVGGIRASMYNALEPEACAALAGFMDEFLKHNG